MNNSNNNNNNDNDDDDDNNNNNNNNNNNILAGSPLHQKVLFSGALHIPREWVNVYEMGSTIF